jgi:hypothetical protein
VQKPNGA